MLRLGQDMAERHRIVQLEVVPRKFGAFVFFMRRRMLLFPKQGQTGLHRGEFVLGVISALPRKQDAAAFKKGAPVRKKVSPTWKHAASSRTQPKAGLLGKEFCKRGQKAHGIGGLASLLENRYYNGMRF